MSRYLSQSTRAGLPLWIVVGVVGLIVGLSAGRSQSMGLYLQPLTAALGTGREPFGLAMALTQLLMGLGAPVAGGLIDKHGAGRVVAGSAAAAMAGLYCLYAAQSSAWLVAAGLLMGVGVSGTGVSSLVGVVGRAAAPEQRLAAISSVGMAAGIGGFVALPLMHLLMETTGWQQSLLWLIAITALLIPLAWPISGRPPPASAVGRQQTLGAALREAFGHGSYWLLTLGYFVCGFHVMFVQTHLPAFALDQGLPPWVGPVALSAVGIANIIGTYLAGRTGRILEKRQTLIAIYLARILIFLGFLTLPMTPAVVIALSSALGLVWLATIPLTSGLIATFFGTAWMSMLFGIVILSHQLGAFVGVWLGGRLYDLLRSYDAMWVISMALGLIAALLHWPIRERPVPRLANMGA